MLLACEWTTCIAAVICGVLFLSWTTAGSPAFHVIARLVRPTCVIKVHLCSDRQFASSSSARMPKIRLCVDYNPQDPLIPSPFASNLWKLALAAFGKLCSRTNCSKQRYNLPPLRFSSLSRVDNAKIFCPQDIERSLRSLAGTLRLHLLKSPSFSSSSLVP